ncbi:MAG: hypothetical protein AB7E76_14250 [Deferribacterales bacterium]
MPSIIQFIHPGREVCPYRKELFVGWNQNNWKNCSSHGRKFIKHKGVQIVNNKTDKGYLCFWAEWEPQSEVVNSYSKHKPGHPKYLQNIFYDTSQMGSVPHNTDPYIFGDCFVHSNCKLERYSSLREIESGSLILYGSCLNKRFVLDTLIVVDKVLDQQKAADKDEVLKYVPQSFIDVTHKLLYKKRAACGTRAGGCTRSKKKLENDHLRLIIGKVFSDPDKPFSFVPCKSYDDCINSGFPRPNIVLDEHITQHLCRGARVTKNLSSEHISDIFTMIKKQITNKGLNLGVRFADVENKGA